MYTHFRKRPKPPNHCFNNFIKFEKEWCWAMLVYNCETAIGVSSKSMVLQSDKLATANNKRWRSFSGFVSTQDIDFSIKLQKFAAALRCFF